jgi:hypothetical protein
MFQTKRYVYVLFICHLSAEKLLKALYEAQLKKVPPMTHKRSNWICHAYYLMTTNDYHLPMETPEGNLSIGMRQLNGVYTQLFTKYHGRNGHLFQGRYKAILIA